MPLLALEPFLHPEDLLSNPAYKSQDDAQWWVLHTRPRAEKALARRFIGRDVPFFLPLYQKRWRSGGRLQTSHLPLFPGYVFLHGDSQVRLAALETNLVANVLPVVDQRRLHADLAAVHRLMESGSPLIPEDRLKPGTPVVITQGSLSGLRGKILNAEHNCRFVIEVQLLQRGASVEIESWMIAPAA
jgi:transcription antitermination factor NusG